MIDNIDVDKMNDDKLIQNDGIEKNNSLHIDVEKKNMLAIHTQIDHLQINTPNKDNQDISQDINMDTSNNVLFIKNISFESTEKDLKELFIK